METSPKVTFLVPTYNTEKYLPQNLEALVNQTLADIEIIAINDGSTDGSLAIMQSFAARDPRVKVIDKPNSGYGASLNMGINQAQGKYIAISEPDDFVEPNFAQVMYKAASKNNADLVKCNYYEYQNGTDAKNKNVKGYFTYGRVFDPAKVPQIICCIPSIWTGLYRRAWLNEENIRFCETPGAAFQDAGFTLKAWFAARRAVLVRQFLMHYRTDNPNSSVKTSDKIFVVCDELAEAQRYFRKYPDRYKDFIPWFHADKWGKYQWNYERINPELHESFVEHIREEYQEARAAEELNVALLDSSSMQQIHDLLNLSPEAFATKYPSLYEIPNTGRSSKFHLLRK